METNAIYCGDCIDILRKFPDKSVDLIYLDPPFFTGRNYEVIWKDGYEIRGFKDAQWYSKGGKRREDVFVYLDWLKERVEQCHKTLKDTGTLYLHCDYHANAYIKVYVLDKIFGKNNFQNEIIWKRTSAHSSARRYGAVHDVVYFYTKSNDYVWNKQFTDYDEEYIKNYYNYTDLKTDRKFRLSDLTGSGSRHGHSGKPWGGYNPTKNNRHWAIPRTVVKELNMSSDLTSQEKLDILDKNGYVFWPKKGKVPSFKRYLDKMEGVPLQDMWTDIKPVQSHSRERQGYPTQKPEGLLERIIKASSNKGDLVLDPFCGCGTAIAVAQKLNRKWIGIDVSSTACGLMAKRLRTLGASPKVIGMPTSKKDLKKIDWQEFQNWVVCYFGGRIPEKKVNDMGIDGLTFELTPIQVKQSHRVGRNVVDNFETAVRRYFAGSKREKKGIIVAFSFTSGAYNEAHRVHLENGLTIELKTVDEILKEE